MKLGFPLQATLLVLIAGAFGGCVRESNVTGLRAFSTDYQVGRVYVLQQDVFLIGGGSYGGEYSAFPPAKQGNTRPHSILEYESDRAMWKRHDVHLLRAGNRIRFVAMVLHEGHPEYGTRLFAVGDVLGPTDPKNGRIVLNGISQAEPFESKAIHIDPAYLRPEKDTPERVTR